MSIYLMGSNKSNAYFAIADWSLTDAPSTMRSNSDARKEAAWRLLMKYDVRKLSPARRRCRAPAAWADEDEMKFPARIIGGNAAK